MFHKLTVEHKKEAESCERKIHNSAADVRDHEERDELPVAVIFWPRCGVHVRCKEILIEDVKNKVHFELHFLEKQTTPYPSRAKAITIAGTFWSRCNRSSNWSCMRVLMEHPIKFCLLIKQNPPDSWFCI